MKCSVIGIVRPGRGSIGLIVVGTPAAGHDMHVASAPVCLPGEEERNKLRQSHRIVGFRKTFERLGDCICTLFAGTRLSRGGTSPASVHCAGSGFLCL